MHTYEYIPTCTHKAYALCHHCHVCEQVGPFKGKIIFHRNRYEDGGAFQLYANAADVIVSEHRFARTEGLLSWGRFNGNAGSRLP